MSSAHGAMMDRVYRRQRHVYDFSRRYFLLGRDRLIASLKPPTGGHVLEIGCGTARNLIAVARLYPDATCYGIDVSRRMLATARASVARSGLAGRIVLGEGDAADFDPRRLFAREAFDRIFISYSLSMIPPWPQALERAAALLGEEGRLHIVDFGQQERLPRWFRVLLFAWLERFHVAPRADLERVLGEIARRRNAILEFRRLYRGYAWSAELRVPDPPSLVKDRAGVLNALTEDAATPETRSFAPPISSV
jgi:S-adenosylmethionine-diacylgycerolhomoserine-N-methlytransferase